MLSLPALLKFLPKRYLIIGALVLILGAGGVFGTIGSRVQVNVLTARIRFLEALLMTSGLTINDVEVLERRVKVLLEDAPEIASRLALIQADIAGMEIGLNVPVLPAELLHHRSGGQVVVYGYVTRTYKTDAGHLFITLNHGEAEVVVWRAYVSAADLGITIGTGISALGRAGKYQNRPQVEVHDLAHIFISP